MADILIATTPTIEGYKIVKVLGTVHGLTVRTRGLWGKFVAGIESMVGGEVTAFTEECEKAKVESMERLKKNARKMRANAIVRTDFETSDIFAGAAVVFSAYGTAVVVEPTR
ncbi:MAG: heavy metal-binding domain-containing protein [Candidatus Aenigmarchaeota archaeon]|nr:heavy metal-binding domain-containing protein [Candidatus Aenigmarchaeota archaeon]